MEGDSVASILSLQNTLLFFYLRGWWLDTCALCVFVDTPRPPDVHPTRTHHGHPSPWAPHAHRTDTPRTPHAQPTDTPWALSGHPVPTLPTPHGHPANAPWAPHGLLTYTPWVPRGPRTDTPRIPHKHPTRAAFTPLRTGFNTICEACRGIDMVPPMAYHRILTAPHGVA